MREFDWLILGREFTADTSIAPIGGGVMEHSRFLGSSEESLQRIDAKAGAVLTHISMMIAAASFMISGVDAHVVEKVVIGVEIAAYLFLALCCLRCLVYRDLASKYEHSHDSLYNNYRSGIRDDVVRNGMILNFAIRWAFFVTFLFMLSVLVHLVL